MTQPLDVMLQNVCTEVQAINTHIRKKPYSYATQMQEKAGLLFLASNERTVKIHEIQKKTLIFLA